MQKLNINTKKKNSFWITKTKISTIVLNLNNCLSVSQFVHITPAVMDYDSKWYRIQYQVKVLVLGLDLELLNWNDVFYLIRAIIL